MSTEIAVRRFSPVTLTERIAFANYLANANALPKEYRRSPADILLAMEFGDSLGIPTVQAMVNVHVIDGKPSANAALIQTLVRRAGHRFRVGGNDQKAWASIVRSDDPDFEYKVEWDLQRALDSGLFDRLENGRPRARSSQGKPLPWEKFPAALLKARCTTEVARDACQEALMGVMYTPEELGAIVDESGDVVVVDGTVSEIPEPKVDQDIAELAMPKGWRQSLADHLLDLDADAAIELYRFAEQVGHEQAMDEIKTVGLQIRAKLQEKEAAAKAAESGSTHAHNPQPPVEGDAPNGGEVRVEGSVEWQGESTSDGEPDSDTPTASTEQLHANARQAVKDWAGDRYKKPPVAEDAAPPPDGPAGPKYTPQENQQRARWRTSFEKNRTRGAEAIESSLNVAASRGWDDLEKEAADAYAVAIGPGSEVVA